ncbi:MAG TPA: DUF6461 domain-containing protein [Friedmanniella sp.]
MPANDDAPTPDSVPDHPWKPDAAEHGGDEDAEIHHAGVRWSRGHAARADVDEDEPYGHINDDALSFHPERLALLDEPDEDVPVLPEAWFVDDRNGFDEAHCITLLEQVGIEDVFSRLKAKQTVGTSSFADFLQEAALQLDDDDDHALIGVADVGRWSLLIESNGFVATRPKRKRALSRGTTTVTLFAGINSSGEYSVTVDGDEQLSFDWMFPADHRGSRSDAFVEDMLAAGLVFKEDGSSGNEVAALAFVEKLTGVRLTVGLLSGLAWRTAVIRNH